MADLKFERRSNYLLVQLEGSVGAGDLVHFPTAFEHMRSGGYDTMLVDIRRAELKLDGMGRWLMGFDLAKSIPANLRFGVLVSPDHLSVGRPVELVLKNRLPGFRLFEDSAEAEKWASGA